MSTRTSRSKKDKAAAEAKAAEAKAEDDKIAFLRNLQKAMLDFLAYNSKNDPAIMVSLLLLVTMSFNMTGAVFQSNQGRIFM